MKRIALVWAFAAVLALALTACGGGGSSTSAGKPEDAAKAFFDAIFVSNKDIAPLVCSSAQSSAAQMKQSFDTMKTALTAAGGTIDISGMTYTAKDVKSDTATVEVGGKIKVSASGVSQDTDFPTTPIPMKLESGAWKVCG